MTTPKPDADAADRAAPTSAPPWKLTGVSLLGFGALSLLAFLGARGLSPALRGTGVGLGGWIDQADLLAACATQLVAAGGIALCLRLVSSLLPLPALGLPYRIALLPTTFIVMVLVAAAVSRPLGASSSTWLALAAFAAPAASLPFVLSRHALRPVGIAAAAFCAAAALDLLSYLVLHRTLLGRPASGYFTVLSSNSALLVDSAGISLAVAFAGTSRQKPLFFWLGSSAFALLAGGWAGFGFGASSHANLRHRLLAAVARQSPFEQSEALAQLVAVLLITGTAALLVLGFERSEARVALCLLALGRLSAGTPVGALFCLAGALLLALSAMNPHTQLEDGEHKLSNALRT